jgi:hypothetical protein
MFKPIDFNNNSSSDRQVIPNRDSRDKLKRMMKLLCIPHNNSTFRTTSLQQSYYTLIIPKKQNISVQLLCDYYQSRQF